MCSALIDRNTRERLRLEALDRYEVLDTPREQDFDDVARLAADICNTPIAVVNLIADQRQFFKAEVGLGVRETPLETSFCAKAILEQDFLLVSDATKDTRFDCNPLVVGEPHLRFYAGALLKTADNFPIGTVCVLDYHPRDLTELQQRTLRVLAKQVMAQLEWRRTARAEGDARRHAEEEKARYRAVFDSATDYAIVVTDRAGTIVDWNPGAVSILGWTRAEILGRHVSIFFSPEDLENRVAEAEMAKARSGGLGADERWHVRKDGERFWATGQMMPLKTGAGALDGFLKILRDRTGQRLAVERMESLDERLKLSLSASGGVGLWDWMLDTDLLHGDENFARMYGLGVNEAAAGVTMEGYQRFVVPADLPGLRAKLRDVFDHGAEFVAEYRIAVPGKDLRWVECKGRIVPAAGNGRPRFSGTAVDITTLKDAEGQKSLLMEELAHRVKNTLAVVQAIAAQTLRTIADPVKASEALGQRLAALARAHDVLLQGSWTKASLRAIVEGASRIHGQGLEGRFVVDGPEITLGPQAALSFSLVLHELGTNAVKYGALSAPEGKVQVTWCSNLVDGKRHLRFRWLELEGPPVAPPERTGFGSTLIRRSFAAGHGVKVHLAYPPEGVTLMIEAPLEALQIA